MSLAMSSARFWRGSAQIPRSWFAFQSESLLGEVGFHLGFALLGGDVGLWNLFNLCFLFGLALIQHGAVIVALLLAAPVTSFAYRPGFCCRAGYQPGFS
jgi:hypothetical protein